MPLTLTVKSYQRLSPAQDSTKTLSAGSLSIGRGDEAGWVLPDPERQISKEHCRIDSVDGNFVLTDTSTNGVFINDRAAPIGRDNAVTLEPGDQIRLGDYEIEVDITEGPGAVEAIAEQDITTGPVSALEDPFSDPLLAGTTSSEPDLLDASLADVPTPGYLDEPALFELDQEDQDRPVEQPRLLGDPEGTEDADPGPPGAAPDHLPGDRAFFQTPDLVTGAAPPVSHPAGDGLFSAASQGGAQIPDDWEEDGLEAPYGPAAGLPAEPSEASRQSPPGGGMIPDDWSLDAEEAGQPQTPATATPAAATQIPDDWDSAESGWPEASPDSLAGPPAESLSDAASSKPGAATADELLDDDAVLLGAAGGPGDAGQNIASTMLDGPEATEAPPARIPPIARAPQAAPDPASTAGGVQRPTPGPRAAVAQTATHASQAQALRAFLDGAQLDAPPINEEEAEDLLRTLGQVYRIMVQGMIEVLAARTSLKNEFRVEQTMIQPVQNNPLKFSLNVDNAMENLLTKRGKGYMSPVEAMQEGFGDLQAHQIATLAGMQSALKSVLLRFDPDQLEQRLEGSSMLESILPGKRKARYWDTFQQLYRDIAREAEDDFQKLFGTAFAEAYEKEIRKQ